MTSACAVGKRQSPWRRCFGVAVPAGGITLGLFLAMQHLVLVEDFHPAEARSYTVKAFIDRSTQDETRPATIKPVRTDDIAPPPPIEPLAKTLTSPDIPVHGFTGSVPAEYGAADLELIRPIPIGSVIDRTLQPITPPVAVYPPRALKLGLEGICEVEFSVSPQGDPVDLSANCTDQVFARAAMQAVQKSKFAPKIHQGRALTVTSVVYPIEFRVSP